MMESMDDERHALIQRERIYEAVIDVVEAMKADDAPMIDGWVDQLLAASDSPEDVVHECLLLFGQTLNAIHVDPNGELAARNVWLEFDPVAQLRAALTADVRPEDV